MPPWACLQASHGQAFYQLRFPQLYLASNWQRTPTTIGPLTQRHATIQLQPFLSELSPRWCVNIKIIIENISTLKTVFKNWNTLKAQEIDENLLNGLSVLTSKPLKRVITKAKDVSKVGKDGTSITLSNRMQTENSWNQAPKLPWTFCAQLILLNFPQIIKIFLWVEQSFNTKKQKCTKVI